MYTINEKRRREAVVSPQSEKQMIEQIIKNIDKIYKAGNTKYKYSEVIEVISILFEIYHPLSFEGRAITKASQMLINNKKLTSLWKGGQRKSNTIFHRTVQRYVIAILSVCGMTIKHYHYEKFIRNRPVCEHTQCTEAVCEDCVDHIEPHVHHTNIIFGWCSVDQSHNTIGRKKFETLNLKAQSLFGFDLHLKPDLSSLNEFIDLAIDKLKIFSDSVNWKHVIISFLLCISSIWCNWDRPATIMMAIAQFVMVLKLKDAVYTQAIEFFYNVYKQAQEAISKIFSKTAGSFGTPVCAPKLKAQFKNGININPLLNLAGGVATSVFTLAVLKRLPGGEKFQNNFERYSKLHGTIRTFNDLQEVGNSFFKSLWSNICYYVFGVEKVEMDEWKNINAWIDEVQDLIRPDFETEIKNNENLKNKIESLLQRGVNILRLLDMLKIPMTERQAITSCMMFLYRARETASNCGAGQTKPRVAPAIIHFYGNSGVGKSTTLWSLIAEIQASLGVTKESDLHEKTYFRRPGGKYWDGYSNGMNIVVCDDYGAIKDTEQTPNEEFLETIHMSNTAFWQLNMADLKDKGNTFFQAKCVLWTSNRSHFAVKSLTNAEAVLRRVDLKIRQRPHPNFSKTDVQGGKEVLILDNDKVNEAINLYGKSAMLQCVVFDIIDKMCPNDTPIKENLGFWEIAELCVQTVQRNLNYFGDFNRVLEEHVGSAIERCKDGIWKKGENTFDPSQFIPTQRVKANISFPGISIYGALQTIREKTGCANVHTGLYDWSKCQLMDLQYGEISSNDQTRLYDLRGMDEQCLIMNSDEVDDFMSCLYSANQAILDEPSMYQNDEMFTNLFHQAEKKVGRRFDFAEIERCNTCKVVDFYEQTKNFIIAKKNSLEDWVTNKFGISPAMFYSILLVGSTLIGFSSYYLYKAIFDRIEKLGQEKLDRNKEGATTRIKLMESDYQGIKSNKLKNIAEGYEQKPKGPQVKTIAETYDQDVKGKVVKPIAEKGIFESMYESISGDVEQICKNVITETYDQSIKCRKSDKNIAEGCWCRNCTDSLENYNPRDDKEFVDKRNILEKACDYVASYIPQGPHGKERCIHGNVKGLCFYCDPNCIKSQAIVDQNAAEVVTNVYNNMYKLEYYNNGEWHHAVNLMIVKGRFAIVNRHILAYAHMSRWRIRNNNFADGIEFNLRECASYYVPDNDKSPYSYRDVMMIELPVLVHQHKDITKKFMDGDDFARFTQLNQISLIGFVPASKIVLRQYFGSDVEADDREFKIERPENEEVLVTARSLIKYNIQTTYGDCGSVLVAFDKNFSNKIFGIHCAGLADTRFQGFGTPVSRGMLDYMLKKIVCNEKSSHMFPEIKVHSDIMRFDVVPEGNVSIWNHEKKMEGNFYPLGLDSQPLFQSGDTKIVPSPVHGVIQTPTMAPAVLKPIVIDGQCVDPMKNARIKASPISKPIDINILKECSYNYFQMINTSDRDKKLLTYKEAISGIEGDDCYPPMKRSTSPGYGWIKSGIGKTKWLGNGEYIYDNKELLDKCTEILNKCRQGIRPSSVWCDTLKDERRTLDKVAKAKTRLFSCGEMAYTLIFRMYFAGFIAHITRNRINVESCVGVNPFSTEWTLIAKRLQEVGGDVLAGDFTNYDGTLHPTILWEILHLINKWYNDSEQNQLIRTALWSEIVNSIHIVGNTFYMWNHSQPSGCPLTVILNCTYHSISARYVYMLCALKYKPDLIGLENYIKYVRHVNYGDDDVWNISPEIIEWFNQITITEAFKYLGMTYTDEAKTGNIVASRKLNEINFLKREFRWDETQARFRAPLSLDTIKEMAMWNHGTIDQYPLTASILEDAVRELAQHEESVFNKHLPKFEKAAMIIRKRSQVNFKTYFQYQFEEEQKLK